MNLLTKFRFVYLSYQQTFRSQLAVFFVLALTFVGCSRIPPAGPQESFREVLAPKLVDDKSLAGLSDAIIAQRSALLSKSDLIMHFGPVNISRAKYVAALDKLQAVLAKSINIEDKLEFIRDNFRFFEFFGGKKWGNVLLTSYFEPVLSGSAVSNQKYSRPLYSKPPDLLTIPLHEFSLKYKGENALKGRQVGDKILPYYSREEIDGKRVLSGKGLELVWLDPIDAFFLHIQGAGTIRLPNGQEEYLVYADKNGRRYEAIGKFLKDRIYPRSVTMQRLESTLKSMSATARDLILFQNPSYVFYSKSKERAITSIGVPATPGRTIAADPKYAPKGALAFIQFSKPIFDASYPPGEDPIGFENASRFVLDQDSGGAITGTNRIDLFWGRGDEAKKYAGIIQHPARIMYLIPR